MLALGGAPVPDSPEAVAAALHKLAPAPQKIRTSMWSVAQFIESRRHRTTLTKFMADLFAAPSEPNALQHWIAGQKLSLVVDAWYDGAMAAAMRAAGRDDFVEIQGATRATLGAEGWTRRYDHAHARCRDASLVARRAVRAARLGAAGAQFPRLRLRLCRSADGDRHPDADPRGSAGDCRASRGFLFLGCRFHDQMLRTYARQIMKRSAGPHFAVVNAETLTRNEAKFLVENAIAPIVTPLEDVAATLIG